ncbi:hypothetical protein JCM10914A_10950 [Paenibacillus sp. JCM 10914]|uniref:hypothetical protein n=1 Tax=Paenibacillus sp. JCM 10914 TaxID=1236974 RepID=UPI0003CC444D|nr:hypothetical protein [Paenibacillus sp. JCM 10914]GAE08158.1 hypothetical protein JCM10914_4424 [Paenibacillus sp. JCM 10914]
MDYGLDEISFAHLWTMKSEIGHIAAGVELSKRKIADNGRTYYEPYHVLSLCYDERAPRSFRQTIPVIASDILRCLDGETKLLVMRSNVPNFRQWRYYERLINVFSATQGVTVKVNHDMRVPRHFSDTVDLAHDAVRRGTSIECAV